MPLIEQKAVIVIHEDEVGGCLIDYRFEPEFTEHSNAHRLCERIVLLLDGVQARAEMMGQSMKNSGN